MHQLIKDKLESIKKVLNKELNQTVMVRTKLRNKFLELKTKENRLAYVRQRS